VDLGGEIPEEVADAGPEGGVGDEGAGGVALLEEDFGEGGGGGAVAGVFLAQGFADG
jgi:hypothetical protein